MPGIRNLRKLQLGLETTKGTAVAATTIWRGKGVLDDQREVRTRQEDVGFIGGIDSTYTPKLQGALPMESVEATFEQLPYILAAGVKDVVTGAADGIGTGKIYDYTFPTTTKNLIKTYTIEGGDDQEAEEMEYSFVEDFTLEGKAGEAVMMGANWIGRQVTVAPFTASLSVPTVEDVLFSLGKLYIDAIGGTFGTTNVANTFLAMSLKVITGWKPEFAGDGNKFFSFEKIAKEGWVFECDITFEHDGTGTARKVDWRAETARKIRMEWLGNNLATAGTNHSKKTLRIDAPAKILKVDKLDEIDGNDVLNVHFFSRYNPTAAVAPLIKLVNELASLP